MTGGVLSRAAKLQIAQFSRSFWVGVRCEDFCDSCAAQQDRTNFPSSVIAPRV